MPPDPVVKKLAETIHMDADLCTMLLHPPTYSQQDAQHAHDMHMIKEATSYLGVKGAGGRSPSSPKRAASPGTDAVTGSNANTSSSGGDGEANSGAQPGLGH